MQFRFVCFVNRHASGRVTVTPLTLPGLAVHATSVERASEELVLALSDRIERAHPRRIVEFVRSGEGELCELDVPALDIWGPRDSQQVSIKVAGVRAPAHKPFVELYLPRLETRLWLEGKAQNDQAVELLKTQLGVLGDARRLAHRRELPETLLELVVEATPTRLAALTPRELRLAERPPRRTPEPEQGDDGEDGAGADNDNGSGGEAEDDAASGFELDDDSWEPKRRARGAGGKPRKIPTPTLTRIAVAWHELARADVLEPAYERAELVQLLAARLATTPTEPVVLVGPAGCGKTAVLHELARHLAAQPAATATAIAAAAANATSRAAGKAPLRPFFHVDGSRLIAGEGFFGDWQKQTLDCLDEARRAKAILSLGHVGALLEAGKSAHSDHNVAELIVAPLIARDLAIVGEATPEEWALVERRNQSFARAWSVLRVEELAPEATARVLARVGASHAAERKLKFEPGAAAESLALCRRFKPYGSLLGNAVTFLRRLIEARAHVLAERVTGADATAQFSSESGIPLLLLSDEVPLSADTVHAFLGARVMGQEAAARRVAEIVTVIKAGLADRLRPVGVLLFAGPTGVGKTELSKALAELIFGSRERLVRIDMGEYAGPDALARLLGDAPGEAATGNLTAAVRRQPFCVVLLDEIEKAHPAVFDALLGVLGEGRLTSAEGRFTDFRNAVIIMTSNLGADTWRGRVGFAGGGPGEAELRRHYIGEAERFFRPELFNRIDDFVVFSPLGAEELRRIVTREVDLVKRRAGLRQADVELAVADDALELLAARGLDPRYGARPLKRAIERDLVVPIATRLAELPEQPLRLTITPAAPGSPQPLALSAHFPGSSGDDSRGAIERVLDDAATLRAEVRKWSRAAPMQSLREILSYFDRASKQPAFWLERTLAEDSARRAAEARELVTGLADVQRQVETTEELAFEAYYERSARDAAALDEELGHARAAFEPLKERLFASLFPPRASATLLMTPGSGAWRQLIYLLDSYRVWAGARDITTRFYTAVWVPVADRPEGRRKDPAAEWRWTARVPSANDGPTPAAVAMVLGGGKQLMLLAAETGAHRFNEAGQTAVVKVRFEPSAMTIGQLPPAHDLARKMPEPEVRRIWPKKRGNEGLCKDLRTGTEMTSGEELLALDELLYAYMMWRIFGQRDGDD
ncbi:MAG: ATP-dependent Clp protease ATP-binding subunit [Deltaproteobacteria bacterium]|nr:ATP-dependent Clp protease ATP-binding subunit [Deltaproteobacteria bacterium]